MFLNQRSAEFSFFYTKRSSFDLYIQTYRELQSLSQSASEETTSPYHSDTLSD